MKLVRDLTRLRLEEGRTSGISHSFCKREGKVFTEVMPLSPCKDYLSDAVWAEHQGAPSEEIYGFSHTPIGLFKNAKFVYLSTASLKKDRDSIPELYDTEKCLEFIHLIEDSLGIGKTKIIETDRYPVLQIDKYWVQYPYLISMYGLFYRRGVHFNGNLEKFFKSQEGYNLSGWIGERAIANYKFLTENKPPLQPWDRSIADIHKAGIKSTNLSILHENEIKAKSKV